MNSKTVNFNTERQIFLIAIQYHYLALRNHCSNSIVCMEWVNSFYLLFRLGLLKICLQQKIEKGSCTPESLFSELSEYLQQIFERFVPVQRMLIAILNFRSQVLVLQCIDESKEFFQMGFNFIHFYPKSANFDLTITPTNIFYNSFRLPFDQIPRFIQPIIFLLLKGFAMNFCCVNSGCLNNHALNRLQKCRAHL